MIHLRGLDDLERNLRRFAETKAGRLAEAAANAAASRFAKGAQRRAPHATGRLAAGIRPLAARVANRRARAAVVSDGPGAAAQELGTRTTPAHPHMRPTQFEDAAAILEAAANAVRSGLESL